MRTAKRILAEFMTVVMVLQACSPTVAAVAAGWQNLSSEIVATSAEASDAAESGETKSDAATGSGSSDTGADSGSAGDSAAKDDAATGDAATGDAVDNTTGSDSTGDQTEGDDAVGDTTTDDTEQDADVAASEDVEAQTDATITNLDDLVTRLEANGAENIVRKDNGSGIQSLDVTVSTAFTVLSNADASLYYDAQININMSGDAKLTEPADNGRLSFQGFGSDAHPFEGKIYSLNSPNDPVELTADRTVFNNLKLTDQTNKVKIKWAGATNYSAPMVASKAIGERKELNATVSIADPVSTDENNDKTSALTAPLLGETTGDLTVNVTYSLTGSRKNLNVNASSNIGLLANTVKSGTFTVGSVEFPDNLAKGGIVKTSSGNAGLLVGEVMDGATLSVGALARVPTATVQSTSGCAGGVVGLVGSSAGATVNVTGALDLNALTVKGTTASGGFIGQATSMSLSQSEGAKVTCPEHVGDSSSKISGGFIGKVSFAQSVEFTGNSQIDTGNGVTLAGASHVKDEVDGAGSVFGVLALDDSNVSVSFKGGSFKSTFGNDASNAAFGGLIGFVSGAADSTAETSPLSLLKVEDATAEFSLVKSSYFAGGIVGWLGTSVAPAALEINNATVKCTQVASTSNGFGGAVGCIDKNSVADVNGITVSNAGSIAKGAGVAAECWAATIRLGGVTDFSNMHFDAGDATAQIAMVRSDSPSLVFARGTGSDKEPTDSNNKDYWIYKRCSATKIDDLGGAQGVAYGYGEVIRLDGDKLPKSLIQINASTHKLKDPSASDRSWQLGYGNSWSGGNRELTINSEKDLACLALSVQFANLWNGVYGLNPDQKAQLLGSDVTINLNHDVDLSGTGIESLGFDSLNNGISFSGTFNGNNHKVALAIGEPYGTRDGNALAADDMSEGNGKIYRHGRLGLFNAVNGASISDVTIAGSMKFDNQSNVDAGALAGAKVGGDTLLTSVTFSAGIEYESTNKDNYVHVGSVFGSISAAGSLRIDSLESPSTINANIASKAQERGVTCVGGAVGYVSGDCVPLASGKTVEVGGLTISGSISIENGSAKTYAGGFIGQISQGGVDGTSGALSSVKQVEITKLDFVEFSLATAGASASNPAGLLGYSWAGAEVTLGDDTVNANAKSHAISTTGSSVSSATATEFGGLVYAASGHWVINDYALNLSGVTLSAPSANKFGMLVCRAGSGVSSAGESLAGLYLENRAPWSTAYVVNEGRNAITTKASVFDEWVADGCKPGNAADDCAVNGVVSLHTREEKLHMTDDDGDRNSYENRTVYGKQPEHQANGLVRYYYNLDRAVAYIKQSGISSDKQGFITKPQELLVWSVSWYAPKALRPYVWRDADSPLLGYNIGRIGAWNNDIQLDMTGYSYYPIDITGINAVVRCSIIKFCFSDINKKESGNKQNSQLSQHMNMHAGLFSSYSGPNSVTIRSVTLQGSIGSASGGTGVLFTKFVKGGSKGTAKVEIKDLTLDGIKVDGAKDAAYAPLLINQLSSKTSLTVKGGYKDDYKPAAGTVQGITVKSGSYKAGEKAATSLFGNLGDEQAEMVTANFQDITVPSSKTDGIFTHASLLESFAYDGAKSGSSASYIFYSKKHKEEDPSFTYCEPTYGAEIDTKGNDSEYEGQQRWYNDKKGYMTDDNLVTDGSIKANEDSPQFASKYLPYVYKSKEGTGEHAHDTYHEIKVNQRVSNLLTGCGTYGDPYALTNAAEVVTVANYINGKESAADGWQIAVIDNQENLCTRRSNGSHDHELIYEYKRSQGSWVCTTDSSKTLSNDTMHSYIQSAYYSIEPAGSKTETLNYIELDGDSFKGFGNKDNPFRGVIVGDLKQGCDKATLKMVKKTRTISGLIPYSYGCVVKNLNVEYSGSSVATGSNDISYTKSGDGIPTSFFGGIFGCILGGDNIIDGVTVSSNGFTVAGDGTKPHLVPIGGYVGAIAGGGVIFRNMTGTSWRARTSDKSRGLGKGNFDLYDNPYVGRVIDGYAFSEDCDVENGDANYKINRLNTTKTGCITTGDINGRYRNKGNNKAAVTTTVKNAQGLLVLSAIISSGAAGGSANASTSAGSYGTPAGSRAYLGGNKTDGTYQFGNQQYGKVRNASYLYVGNPENAAGDFVDAKKDDMQSPGIQAVGDALGYAGNGSDVNSPYLVRKYATWQTGYICAAQVSGMDLQFAANEEFNMTDYGSGFTGLSGRYYSNACASTSGADRDRIVPLIACINGNGATIKVKNNTQEYTDDDFCVAGVGGLFNTVTFCAKDYSSESFKKNDSAHMKDISFEGCYISLTYINSAGDELSTSPKVDNNRVGVGCFAGSTANAASRNGMTGSFKNVRISSSDVSGGSNAGGLIGTAGWMVRSTKNEAGLIVDATDYSVFPVNLYDCSYSGLNVSARSYAAGFVGSILSGASGLWVASNTTVANNSIISIVEKGKESANEGCAAGGLFGLAGGETYVDTGQSAGSLQVATIEDMAIVVNHKAAGIGGIVGQANKQVSANRVKVTSTKEPSSVSPTYFGSLQAVNNTENAYAINAGCLVGIAKAGVTADSCTVEKIRMGVTEHAGGLVGATTNGNTLSATNIAVDGVQFDGARCGGILGNCQGQGATNVVVANATVQNCSFGTLNSKWNHGDGDLRNHSGGIVGAASGTIKIANALISKNDFKQPGGQGFLLGDTAQTASDFKGLYAAGVDIVLKDESNNSSAQKPIKYFNDSVVADVNKKSYIAFGDYEDTLFDADGATLYGNDAKTGNVTAAVSPYVTTSPKSRLAVRTSDGDATDRYLFGDGMNVDLATTIMSQAGDNVDNRYTYNNIGGINNDGVYQKTSSYDADSVASTFNANNDASSNKTTTNFPVLVISGTDNTTVTSYLNIITNGGFSDACRLNGTDITKAHVTAKAEVFQLKNGLFVKDDEASNNPTLRVVNNGKKNMSFSPSSDWDNGKGRFTLLTVTFTEAGQSYNVQVPIIVKRKLEIDFTATYDYGTNFKESNYAQLGKDAHVLTSFGEPMTGLLTWTYNSAKGTEVDFGWDSYMAAGGSMKGLGKGILFDGADGRLPRGTQLTLVDANVDGKAGGREYHYTVGEGGATSVSLSGDDGFKDSADKPYQERWLSEILDVSATKDGAGTWTVCDNEADATAKAKLDGKWTLFKVAGADVPGDKRYKLTVPKDKGKEKRASESVYLVVNVPKSAGVSKINGFTNTPGSFDSSSSRVAVNMHRVLRPNNASGGKDPDIQNNTASTYSILSNYGQTVVDNEGKARTLVSQSQDGAAYVLSLDVTDAITFNTDQIYATNDSLFYQLDTSLCKYDANDTLKGVSSFPSGTSAIAEFYVAIGSQCYTWDSIGKKWVTCDASTPAFTQTVTDTGNDSLKLTLEHNLAGIRALATGGSFTVHTVVKEVRLTPDGCNDVIALSQESGEDACTKMSYIAKLSTRKSGLDTSSLAVTTRGNVGYYRMNKGGATITLSAPDKSQLGINVDDLRPIADGTIGLGATYEVGGLSNAAEVIASAGSVVYTLKLQRRSGPNGSYEDVTGKISDYVTVTESKLATVNAADSAITFTDSTKENGKFRTQNGDTTFNLPFTVKVNTQVEQGGQFYANYRLVMTASLVTNDVASATPQSPDYVTYTLTRVNLNGIDH